MIVTLFASLSLASAECDSFLERIGEDLRIELSHVSGPDIGGIPLARRSQQGLFLVGSLIYDGRGFSAWSQDDRFDGIMVSPDRGPYHRCGYGWTTAPNVWDLGPSWPQEKVIVFRDRAAVPSVNPGSIRAARAGAQPVVEGHETVATWPFGQNFVGLMRPTSGRTETLIVQFSPPAANQRTAVLARLPMVLQFIAVMGDPHSANRNIHVWGREPGGPYRHIMFWADDPTREDPSLSLPR